MAKVEAIRPEDLDEIINRAYDQFIKDVNGSVEESHLMMLVNKHVSDDPRLRQRLRTYVRAVFENVIDRETAKGTLGLFYEELGEAFRASIDKMDGKYSLGLHGARDSKFVDPPVEKILDKAYGKEG